MCPAACRRFSTSGVDSSLWISYSLFFFYQQNKCPLSGWGQQCIKNTRGEEGAIEWKSGETIWQGGCCCVFFFAVFGEEICLASYLSTDVGSLICLLLLSPLLLKPAVSVDCLWSLRQAVGWKEEKQRGDGEMKHRCRHIYTRKAHSGL